MVQLEQVHQKAPKVGHLPCKGGLKDQVLFSLEKSWLEGRPNSSLQGPARVKKTEPPTSQWGITGE